VSQIQQISGRGIPLRGNDIDTDRIIPARFLRCVTFDGLGAQVFADDRAQEGGNAPQALAKWGIQAILGESFAEIFSGNCLAIGIPCVTATPATVQQLQRALEDNPKNAIALDLNALQVHCGNLTVSVQMGDGPHQMLTTGTWDSCCQLVARAEQIRATAAQVPYLSWQSQS
jgi:3-isopropylmalate/(R)-2-methylmalate dehydratase small subunit